MILETSNLIIRSLNEKDKSVYRVKNTHMINDDGHMLYLSYWGDIVRKLDD